jgi:Tol biopolymer transport system component
VEFAVPGHNVRAAAYSPDGHAIAVSGSNGVSIHDALDGSVRLGWKYADGMTHTSSIAWSPDGKLLAVTTDTHQPSRIHVYDVKSGEELQSLSESPETREQIGHVTWSPDGKYLAVTGAVDISTNEPDQRNRNKLVIWDTSEWQSVFTRPIAAVALRFHDRTTLVYATHDRQVLYENVETDKELRRIPAGVAGQYAIMSPDGEDLLSVNGDRIRVHSLTDGSLKGTILPFLGTRPDWAIISATGHYAGSPDAHKYARHVIRTRAGIRSLTPFEFRNEFSWKNDPSKVRLTAE